MLSISNINWIDSLVGVLKSYIFASPSHELVSLATAIFMIGIIGLLDSVDFFGFLISLEVVMLGINFYLLTWSVLLGDPAGQAFAIFILAAVVGESIIGLGILVCLYKTTGLVSFTDSSTLKG